MILVKKDFMPRLLVAEGGLKKGIPVCAAMLVNSGLQNVEVAMLDPDPRNSGKGIQILRQANIN